MMIYNQLLQMTKMNKIKNPYLRYMIEKFENRKDKEEKFVNWCYNKVVEKTAIKEVFYWKNLKGDL